MFNYFRSKENISLVKLYYRIFQKQIWTFISLSIVLLLVILPLEILTFGETDTSSNESNYLSTILLTSVSTIGVIIFSFIQMTITQDLVRRSTLHRRISNTSITLLNYMFTIFCIYFAIGFIWFYSAFLIQFLMFSIAGSHFTVNWLRLIIYPSIWISILIFVSQYISLTNLNGNTKGFVLILICLLWYAFAILPIIIELDDYNNTISKLLLLVPLTNMNIIVLAFEKNISLNLVQETSFISLNILMLVVLFLVVKSKYKIIW